MITLINEKDLNKTTIGPDRINPLESLNDVTLGIGLQGVIRSGPIDRPVSRVPVTFWARNFTTVTSVVSDHPWYTTKWSLTGDRQ